MEIDQLETEHQGPPMWILMIYLYYQAGGLTAEFTSREKCEAAAAAFFAKVKAGNSQTYICVEK